MFWAHAHRQPGEIGAGRDDGRRKAARRIAPTSLGQAASGPQGRSNWTTHRSADLLVHGSTDPHQYETIRSMVLACPTQRVTMSREGGRRTNRFSALISSIRL